MLIFKNIIEEIYDDLSNNSVSINDKIHSKKLELSMDEHESFRDYYNNLIKNDKSKGRVYTPKVIVEFILKEVIKAKDIINNPFIKILDPSCGGGNFIIPLYNYLYKLYSENLKVINDKHNLHLNKKNINKHILENNIYGMDIDAMALKILHIDMWIENQEVFYNLKCGDFLTYNGEEKFNSIIGNPPYIGHKAIEKDYVKVLKMFYSDVYKDKSDISYCFFKKAMTMLSYDGSIAFITSRYFMEAKCGDGFRDYLLNKNNIFKIVDFYGVRPFKGNGIDAAIVFIDNKKKTNIDILRPVIETKDDFDLMNSQSFYEISMDKKKLTGEPWIIVSEEEDRIIKKIEDKGEFKLEDACKSFQGIITGCDKAFVVDEDILKTHKIEMDIVKPWIKNSKVKKEKKIECSKYLLYSNDIEDEKKYKNAIKYISEHEKKLKNRRECKKGIRKWYELQWGREKKMFEGEKIVFPYKGNKNNFVLDKGSFFSADIYGLYVTKEDLNKKWIVDTLNSKLYEFYIKIRLKKLGADLYEYYPNKFNNIWLCYDKFNKLYNEVSDDNLFKFFDISEKEKDIIKRRIT